MTRFALFTVTVAAVSLVTGVRPAHGASFNVNATHDAVDAAPGNSVCADASGFCTLRAAVMETNALAGADSITVPAGTYTLTIPGLWEDFALAGDIDIRDELNVDGAGQSSTIVQACGGTACHGVDRVFEIGAGYSNARTVISSMTIKNGTPWPFGSGPEAGGGGGAILNNGVTTITGVTVRNNYALEAGGIYNELAATLKVVDSTITDNIADGNPSSRGGGVSSYGTLIIESSEVVNNWARFWGGGIVSNGNLTVTDSTISDNVAGGPGSFAGGVSAGGDTTIKRSTIARNDAGFGSGIYAGGVGSLTVTESLVADNSAIGVEIGPFNFDPSAAQFGLTNVTIAGNAGGIAVGAFNTVSIRNGTITDSVHGGASIRATNTIFASDLGVNCEEGVTSLGHNLSSDGSCGLNAPGDLSNTNPVLAPLAGNGGPTQTQALLVGSPAIDAADPAACPANDQRRFARPVDGNGDTNAICDIGAFEFGAVGPPLPVGGQVEISTPKALPTTGGSPGEANTVLPVTLGLAIAATTLATLTYLLRATTR